MRRNRVENTFLARFGSILAKSGVASIPQALFYYQAELGLSVEATWFASVLLAYRWTSDIPFPSLNRISKRAGVSVDTLRRYRRALEEVRWRGQPVLTVLERQRSNGAQSSNGYDLTVLLKGLEELVMRDRAVWFKNAPLAEDPTAMSASDDIDAQIVDNGVDNPVHSSAAPSKTASGAPGESAGGAGRRTARGVPGTTATGPEPVAAGGTPANLRAHEVDTLNGETEERRPLLTDDPETTAQLSSSKPVRPAANSKADASSGSRQQTNGEDMARSDWIDNVIADYTPDLHDDPANTKRNQTQARRIWAESGFSEEKFVDRLAKAKRRAAAARVTKPSVDGSGLPNRMPYFFRVLRDITGVD